MDTITEPGTAPVDLVIADVRLDGAAVDIVVSGESISEIVPAGTSTAATPSRIDGRGGVVLPGLVDAHAHLDKTLWGLPWRPHTGAPGLAAMVANEREHRGALPPVADRAEALLRAYVDAGVLHVRSHVDVDPDAGLDGIRGVREAARRTGIPIDVEIVAFPQSGLLLEDRTLGLLEEAVADGVTVIGGLDPAACDRDPRRSLDAIFDLAVRHDCKLDIHLHSRGELGAFEIEEVVRRVEDVGLQGRVNLGHAFCLSTVAESRTGQLVEMLARADVSVTTVAAGSVPVLPLRLMRELGVAVGLGQDGVRDLWSPFGTGDLLERVTMLAWQAGFRRDDDLAIALATATTGAARILGLDGYGVAVGAPATLVVVPAETEAEAVVAHPPRSAVVCRGQVVTPGSGDTVGARDQR